MSHGTKPRASEKQVLKYRRYCMFISFKRGASIEMPKAFYVYCFWAKRYKKPYKIIHIAKIYKHTMPSAF